MGRDLLEDEVISISWWRRQHDDHRDEPVLEEAGEGGIEWFVARPDPGEWKDAFPTELLDHCGKRLAGGGMRSCDTYVGLERR